MKHFNHYEIKKVIHHIEALVDDMREETRLNADNEIVRYSSRERYYADRNSALFMIAKLKEMVTNSEIVVGHPDPDQ